MARGIDGASIFAADVDRQDFVDRLGRVIAVAGAAVYAWSLLPNHFHLLLRTGPTPLSLLMRRLLTGHAICFNRRYSRTGYLFQNRFKSILVHDETYFLTLVRYIHLNPLRARIVSSLDELDAYPWSGHRALLHDIGPPWQSVAEVLARYSPNIAVARRSYRHFVADGDQVATAADVAGGGFVRTGQGWRHVERLRRAREAWVPAERVLVARPSMGLDLEAALPAVTPSRPPRQHTTDSSSFIDRVAQHLGLGRKEIAGESRTARVTRGRTILVHLLVHRRGLSFDETARVLGISKWAVRRAVQRTVPAHELAAIPA